MSEELRQPEVRLSMPARSEGVGVVRQALVGLSDGLAIDEVVLADMKTAVTEACTNVVVHAYGDEEDGTLEVDLHAGESALTVIVRDRGTGIRPRPVRSEAAGLGLGLPLIAALSDAFEVKGSSDGGTEVLMRFDYQRLADPVVEHPIQPPA